MTNEQMDMTQSIVSLAKALNEKIIEGKKIGVEAKLSLDGTRYQLGHTNLEVSFKFEAPIEGAMPKPVFE